MHTVQVQQAQAQLKAALLALVAAHAEQPGPPDSITAHLIVDDTGVFQGAYECAIAAPGQRQMLPIAGGSL